MIDLLIVLTGLNIDRARKHNFDCSETMSPHELLWHRVLWYLSKCLQPWSFFKVDIKAVSKANFLLSIKPTCFDSERVLDLSSALLVACNGVFPNEFAEFHGLESTLNLLLFSLYFFKGVSISGFFEGK